LLHFLSAINEEDDSDVVEEELGVGGKWWNDDNF
jgi:hypothetical protein